jgi:predicted  nucleic acid-binding Zn-ribbon protein
MDDKHLELLTELQSNKLPEKPYTQMFADTPNTSPFYQSHSQVETLKQKLASYEVTLEVYKTTLELANATIKEARERLERAETDKARLRKLLTDHGVEVMDDSS